MSKDTINLMKIICNDIQNVNKSICDCEYYERCFACQGTNDSLWSWLYIRLHQDGYQPGYEMCSCGEWHIVNEFSKCVKCNADMIDEDYNNLNKIFQLPLTRR